MKNINHKKKKDNIDDCVERSLELHPPRINVSPIYDVNKEYFIDAHLGARREVDSLESDLRRTLLESGMDDAHATQLVYSTIEAVRNAQDHAYNRLRGKKVHVKAKIAPDYAEVSVISKDGNPLDIDKVPAIIKNAETTHITEMDDSAGSGVRGSGLHQIKLMCDEVRITTKGDYTEVRLRKLKKPQAYEKVA